jgi:uncharacterized protein YcbK (DUF882 family)
LQTSRPSVRSASRLARALAALTAFLLVLSPSLTETAIANGDTRTIYLHHAHTGEDIAATYLVNGQYDSNVLKQLNWFLRDWRRDEPTNMDPRLFDVVWEAYRGAGASNQVINVVSAYRSPETNAMLRSRSRAVAKYSQHMLGKAMDTTMPGMPMSHIREVGMRMQRGGVGYYPTANTPFVHLDVGNVRSWPRMTYDQLARLFPDGKTVHLPTNGQPLPGYEQARAEIEARGDGAYVTAPRNPFGGFFAMLFGGGAEEDDSEVAAPAPSNRKQWALATRKRRGAASDADGGEEGGGESAGNTRAQTEIARAQADLPRGETTMSAPGEAPTAESAAPEQTSEAPSNAESSEEAPPPKRVKAPFPPRRPSMLLATVSEAPLRGGRATSSKTTETKDAHAKSSTDKRGATSRQTELTTAPLDASGFTRSTAASGKNKAATPTTTATAAKAKTSSPATSASTTKPAPATKSSTTAKPVTTAKPAASTKPATSEPATNGAKRKN